VLTRRPSVFRPDISPVDTGRASVMRRRRSLLVAGGRCRCCHRCCQRGPESGRSGVTRLCAWRESSIPAGARRDAVCCSVCCRLARRRFLRAVGYAEAVARGRLLRLAYAAPPYPGKARLYRDYPDFGGEVDDAGLIERLAAYDEWALSTSAQAPPAVLALCRPGSGWLPGTAASVPHLAGGRCMPGSRSSATAARACMLGTLRAGKSMATGTSVYSKTRSEGSRDEDSPVKAP
jgi:hypothetical protein